MSYSSNDFHNTIEEMREEHQHVKQLVCKLGDTKVIVKKPIDGFLEPTEVMIFPLPPPPKPTKHKAEKQDMPYDNTFSFQTLYLTNLKELERAAEQDKPGFQNWSAVGILVSWVAMGFVSWIPLVVSVVCSSSLVCKTELKTTNFFEGVAVSLLSPFLLIHAYLPKKKVERKFSIDSYSATCLKIVEKDGIESYDKVIENIENFEKELEKNNGI